jgi:acetylornithine/N-succinyldiaminopimelate aminotransferase
MLEPIQGEGGVNIPADDYLKEVRAWCDEKGILLILDEVQTGIGRIGTLFGHVSFGVEPDIMALGKGLGGGVPLGAFLAREKASVFAPGEHGSTFGGNPLACAAGYATLKYLIEEDIPGKVRETGAYLMSELNKLKSKYDFITELLNPVKPNAVRFVPPLNITKNDVDEAVGILEPVLAEIVK